MLRPLAATLLLIATLGAADDYTAVTPPAERPMLGVEMSPVPTHVQEAQGLTPQQGVYVQSTFPGTAAQSMLLQPGDVILAVNGAPITSMTDLRNEVGLGTVGDTVEVSVVRNGAVQNYAAPLQSWPTTIPREPIDAAAEKRFRDFQERRQTQQRDEATELAKRADAAAAQAGLGGGGRATEPGARATPGEASAAFAAAAAANQGGKPLNPQVLPPWHMDILVDGGTDLDAPVLAALPPVAAPQSDGEGPWHLTYTTAP